MEDFGSFLNEFVLNESRHKEKVMTVRDVKNKMIKIKTQALNAKSQEEYSLILTNGFNTILKELRGL